MDHKIYLPSEIINIIISYIQPHPIAILINKYVMAYKHFCCNLFKGSCYVFSYNDFFEFFKCYKYDYEDCLICAKRRYNKDDRYLKCCRCKTPILKNELYYKCYRYRFDNCNKCTGFFTPGLRLHL